jgi:hypothetical protein
MPSLISQLPGCRPSVGGAGFCVGRQTHAATTRKNIYLLMKEILLASLLGLATTSSAMIGIAVGLYVPISKRLLGCILAFASGGLISALAIELAFNRRSSFTISALASAPLGCPSAAASPSARSSIACSLAISSKMVLPSATNALSRIHPEASRA